MKANLLKGKINAYMGFEVDIESLPESASKFSLIINNSIQKWEKDNIEVVWLRIPEKKPYLIQPAISVGFKFHHTDKNKLVMVRKMHDNAFIIPYASHYIGVGGIAIDDQNRILTVREIYGNRKSDHYKLPGGTLEHNEHIQHAVKREVLEETGIKTKFNSMICLRHRHKYKFNKSDIYFICLLTPLNTEISIETDEIAEAVWMDVDEYLNHKYIHSFNKEIVKAALKGNVLSKKDIDGYITDNSLYEIFMP